MGGLGGDSSDSVSGGMAVQQHQQHSVLIEDVKRVLLEAWAVQRPVEGTTGLLKLMCGGIANQVLPHALAELTSATHSQHHQLREQAVHAMRMHLFNITDFMKALLRHAKPPPLVTDGTTDSGVPVPVPVAIHSVNFTCKFLVDKLHTDSCLQLDKVRQGRAKYVHDAPGIPRTYPKGYVPPEVLADVETKWRIWAKIIAHVVPWAMKWTIHLLGQDMDAKRPIEMIHSILQQPLLVLLMLQNLQKEVLDLNQIFEMLDEVVTSKKLCNLPLKSISFLWKNLMCSYFHETYVTPTFFRECTRIDHDALASIPVLIELENASFFPTSEDDFSRNLLFQERIFTLNPFQVGLNLIVSALQTYCATTEKHGHGESFVQLSFVLSKLPRVLRQYFELSILDQTSIPTVIEKIILRLARIPALALKKEFDNSFSMISLLVDTFLFQNLVRPQFVQEIKRIPGILIPSDRIGSFHCESLEAGIRCQSLDELDALVSRFVSFSSAGGEITLSLPTVRFLLLLAFSKQPNFYRVQNLICTKFVLSVTDCLFWRVFDSWTTTRSLECFKSVVQFIATTDNLSIIQMHGCLQYVLDNISRFCITCAAKPVSESTHGDDSKEEHLIGAFTLGLQIMLYCQQTFDLVASDTLTKDSNILIDSAINFSSKTKRQLDLQKLDNLYNQFRSKPSEPYQNCRPFPPLDVILCAAHRIFPNLFSSSSRVESADRVRYFQQLVHAVPYIATPMFLPLCAKLEDLAADSKTEVNILAGFIHLLDKMVDALKSFETQYRLAFDVLLFQLFKVLSKVQDVAAILRKTSLLSHYPKFKSFFYPHDKDRIRTLATHLDFALENLNQYTFGMTLGDHRPLRAPTFAVYRVCCQELGSAKFLELVLNALLDTCGVLKSPVDVDPKVAAKRARPQRIRSRAFRIGESLGWIAAHIGGLGILEILLKSLQTDLRKVLQNANSEKSGKALAMFFFTYLSKLYSSMKAKDFELLKALWRFLSDELKTTSDKNSKIHPGMSSFVLMLLAMLSACGRFGLFQKLLVKRSLSSPLLNSGISIDNAQDGSQLKLEDGGTQKMNRVGSTSFGPLNYSQLREELIENLLSAEQLSIAMSLIDITNNDDIQLLLHSYVKTK